MNKFNHTLYKEMWHWLASNPEKDKEDWPRWYEAGGDIPRQTNWCFACDYTNPFTPDKYVPALCAECPLDWGEPEDLRHNFVFMCEKEGSPYLSWLDSEFEFLEGEEREKALSQRSAFAREVAELPVREEVETT